MESYIVSYGPIRDFVGTKLNQFPLIDLSLQPDYQFKPGARYLVFWNDHASNPNEQPYNLISKRYHLGPRSEGHYECTKMKYLKLREGIIFKFMYLRYERVTQWLTKDEYIQMEPLKDKLSRRLKDVEFATGISKKNGRPWYRLNYLAVSTADPNLLDFLTKEEYEEVSPQLKGWGLVRTDEQIDKAFNYFMSHDQLYGFDYETSGIPMEYPDYFPMGLGIVGEDAYGVFFDIDWMNQIGGNIEHFKTRLKEFCDKYEYKIITYNSKFEMSCTYLLLHKLYLFSEGGTINKLDGKVERNFSLKYTAMRRCYVASWDDDFDLLTELLDHMMNGIWKSGRQEREGYTIDNYKESEEWKKIVKTYPNDLEEFDRLIHTHWSYHFACIPATILGKYCTLDAFYTVQLKVAANKDYKPEAWECYDSNLKLGALLNIHGAHLDIPLRNEMRLISGVICAYGQVNCLRLWVNYQLNSYKVKPNIPPAFERLLNKGLNPYDSRVVIQNLWNKGEDLVETIDRIREYYDDEIAECIHENVVAYFGVIDESSFRKRKAFNIIDQFISTKWLRDEQEGKTIYTIDGETYESIYTIDELVQYCEYKNQWNKLEQFNKLIDIDHPQEWYEVDGEKWNHYDIVGYCSGIYNVMSFKQKNDFYIASYYHYRECVMHQLIEGSQTPEEFIKIRDQYGPVNLEYVHSLDRTYGDPGYADRVKMLDDLDIDCTNFLTKYRPQLDSIYNAYGDYIPLRTYDLRANPIVTVFHILDDGIIDWVSKYTTIGNEIDLSNISKELQDLYDRIVVAADEWLNVFQYAGFEDLPDEVDDYMYAHFNEFDTLDKSSAGLAKFGHLWIAKNKYMKVLSTYIDGQFSKYNWETNGYDENFVATERWEGSNKTQDWNNELMYSPYNVSQKKSKRWAASMHTVPSQSEVKRILCPPKGYGIYYFDISGAEVRAISYISQDAYMLDCYNKGLDPYINLAQILEPGHDKAYYKKRRKDYKVILLGSLYGMGVGMLSERTGLSENEAAEKQYQMFQRMSGIKRLIEEKGQYCLDHNGLVESYLGDVLEMNDNDGPDRYARLGINQFIQNIAAVSLGHGFYNICDVAMHSNPKLNIIPVNVVHDSMQAFFPLDFIFELQPYCHKNMSDFLFERYHIRYEFDTEVGANYYDMNELDYIDDHTIKFVGNYLSIYKFLTKIKNESNLKVYLSNLRNEKTEEDLQLVNGWIDNVEGFKKKTRGTYMRQFMSHQFWGKSLLHSWVTMNENFFNSGEALLR